MQIILDSIDGFIDRREDFGCELNGASAEGKRARRLLGSHELVHIEFLDHMEMVLTPWDRGGAGGRTPVAGEGIRASTATPPEAFFEILSQCFERCGRVY